MRENYWVWAILSEISRLTEHMWPENLFSFMEDKQISWIKLYGVDNAW